MQNEHSRRLSGIFFNGYIMSARSKRGEKGESRERVGCMKEENTKRVVTHFLN